MRILTTRTIKRRSKKAIRLMVGAGLVGGELGGVFTGTASGVVAGIGFGLLGYVFATLTTKFPRFLGD